MTSRVVYQGNLRTECEHIKSGNKVITDAPVDNHGKGEAFSPTDFVATSLASCMLTVVGIYCNNHSIELKECTADVTKIMDSNPRRISEIKISMNFLENKFDDKLQKIIKNVVETCPVQNSIHPEINVVLDYQF